VSVESGQPAHILVIRRDNIGDLVCTTPLLTALRQRHPQARISVLANSYNAAVLEGNDDIDALYTYTKRKHRGNRSTLRIYWERFLMLRELRRQGVDLAILATPASDRHGLKLARQVGAACIMGVDDGSLGLDRAISPATLLGLHQVERIFLLAGFSKESPYPLKIVVSEQEQAWAGVRLAEAGLSGEKAPVGLHISARKPCNRWPVERHLALIESIHRNTGRVVVLFWSPGSASDKRHPGDDELAERIVREVGDEAVLIPFATRELRQLVAGLSQVDTLVCSDGGAMHLAAGLGRPVVCLFGYDGGSEWAPWGEHRLLYAEPLDQLDPQEVISALQHYL
jgi:ADP-heptose:LPS heptosyltransferase